MVTDYDIDKALSEGTYTLEISMKENLFKEGKRHFYYNENLDNLESVVNCIKVALEVNRDEVEIHCKYNPYEPYRMTEKEYNFYCEEYPFQMDDQEVIIVDNDDNEIDRRKFTMSVCDEEENETEDNYPIELVEE